MATGVFYPINRNKFGGLFVMDIKSLPNIIKRQKLKVICINYAGKDISKVNVKDAFNSILPGKSSYEL